METTHSAYYFVTVCQMSIFSLFRSGVRDYFREVITPRGENNSCEIMMTSVPDITVLEKTT